MLRLTACPMRTADTSLQLHTLRYDYAALHAVLKAYPDIQLTSASSIPAEQAEHPITGHAGIRAPTRPRSTARSPLKRAKLVAPSQYCGATSVARDSSSQKVGPSRPRAVRSRNSATKFIACIGCMQCSSSCVKCSVDRSACLQECCSMRSAVVLAQFYNIIPLRIRTIMHYCCTQQHLVIAVNVSTNYSSESCYCSSYLTVANSRGSQCKQPQHSAHSLSLAVTAHIGPVNIYINSFKMVTCLLPFRTAPSCIYPGTLTHCTAC
eukprot:2487-Heterococcus_DN1.PRE.1